MSTTIDKKVVEMQFNNSNFESNVKTSMSTLEKLKNALNFSGSTKGLEDINSAVNNVNMSGLGSAVETVQAKFSALEVVAVTALATITNQAVQAGEQLVASLTVDQIASGWEKFASKTTSVGTLISQGYDIETVTEQLERLNWYTDETSYNFTDMVSNIAKFTASGQDLETSVTAMEGIANWAALSGQNASTASRAMYQLAQAMSAGYMRLEDYKSIQNASMDTEEFRQKCIDAALALGTLQENADGSYSSLVDGAEAADFTLSSFTTNLTKGCWLTSDVMMSVFNDYANAVDQIYEYAEEKEITASQAIEELGDTVDEFGLKAFKAAQEARTWADVVDSVKDAASTAWMNIFELFIGNYEQATALYTSMANTLYDIFVGPLNNLYDTLEGALSNNPFTELAEKIASVTSPVTELADEIENITSATEKYAAVVDSIIKGDWGNGQARWDALTEAGYDWAYAQNLVNEKLGDSTRHATDYTEATEELTEAQNELTDSLTPTIEELTNMSEAELDALGFTEDEIEALRELAEAAEKTGIPIEDLVEDISQLNGRTLLLSGLKNICESLMTVFSTMGEAWSNTFPATTSEQIYDIIASFHKFTTTLIPTEEALEKITRTFEGLFSVLKLGKTLIGSGVKAVFKVFKSVLDDCDISILDITANVGDALKEFTEWVNQNDRLTNGIDHIADKMIEGIKVIKKYINAFLELPVVQKIIEQVSYVFENFGSIVTEIADSAFESFIEGGGGVSGVLEVIFDKVIDLVQAFSDLIFYLTGYDLSFFTGKFVSVLEKIRDKVVGFVKGIQDDFDLKEVAENAIEGLKEGFQNGIPSVSEILAAIGTAILTTIKNVLGIHSPSTEMYEVGTNAMEGLKNGFSDGLSGITETIKSIGSSILSAFENIDWSAIYSGGISIALIYLAKRMTDTLDSALALPEGIGNVLSSVSGILEKSKKQITNILKSVNKVVKSFSSTIKAYNFSTSANAIKSLAIALAVLVAAILAIVLLVDDENIDKLWTAVEIVAVLAAILAVLAIALSKISSSTALVSKEGLNLSSSLPNLLGIAAALLIVAVAVKQLGSLATGEGKLISSIGAMAVIVALLIGLVGSMTVLSNMSFGLNTTAIVAMCIGVAAALLIMTAAVKLAGGLSTDDILAGIGFVGAFLVFLAILIGITKISSDKQIAKVGTLLLSVSFAMILMVAVVKLASMLSIEEMEKGALFVAGFTVFLAALVAITKISSDKQIAKISGLLLSVSLSLLIMVAVVKLVESLSPEAMEKGVDFIGAFMVFVIVLMSVATLLPSSKVSKISLTLLAMLVSVGVLAGIAVLLSLIDTAALAKGIVAVGLLSTIMSLLAVSTKFATGNFKTLLAMAAAIAVLAVAVVALSFVDVEDLVGAVAILSALMAVFAVMVNLTRGFNSSFTSLLAMAAVIAVLAASIYVLSTLPTDSALTAVGVLTAVMVAVAAMMLIVGNIKSVSVTALAALVVVTAVVAAIAGILYLLVDKIGWRHEQCLNIAIALSTLLLSLAATCGVLALVGVAGTSALVGIGALLVLVASLATLFTALGAIFDETSLKTLQEGIEIAETIGYGIGSFVGNIVGGFAAGVTSGLPEIGQNLSDFATNASTFFDTIGDLDEGSANGVKALAETILTLTKANIKEALTSWFTGGTDFSAFGTSLVELGEGLAAYSEAISGQNIDLKAVKNSAEAISVLADLDKNLPSTGGKLQEWLGQKDLSYFGTGLTALGEGIFAYYDSIKDITDIDKIKESAEAAEALADLDDNLPSTGGKLQEWLGQKDLDSFGDSLEALGTGISKYYDSIKDIKGLGDDDNVITTSAEAAEALATLNNNLPSTDGKLQEWFGGTMDLATFGNSLEALGTGLCAYLNALGEGFNPTLVTRSANAAAAISELQTNLPSSSDKLRNWIGEVGKDGLSNLEYFAQYLVKYSQALGEDFDASIVKDSANAALVLADLDNNLPSTGGKLQEWLGSKDLATFGSSLYTLGAGIADYSAALKKNGGFNTEQIGLSANAVSVLADLANNLPSTDGKIQEWFGGTVDIATFGEQLATFGSGLAEYYNRVEYINLEKLSTITSNIQDIVDLVNTVSGTNSYSFDGFSNALVNLAETGIAGFVETFNSSTEEVMLAMNSLLLACVGTIDTKKTTFETAGTGLIDSLKTGLDSKRDTITTFFTNAMTSCISAITTRNTSFNTAGAQSMSSYITGTQKQSGAVISEFGTATDNAVSKVRSYYSAFESAGAYLVEGFAAGISANTYAAEAQASAMASAAADAARTALDEHSPSKVGYGIGNFFGLGFVNAIGDYADTAYDASYEMANSATSGLNTVISNLADIVSGDLDMEPTIRPVLDLSGVQKEAMKLNTIFSSNQALTVSASMDRLAGAKVQNGSESDGGNTYQFYQTNNSPKALSRTEIYRQTKNQFAAFERMVEA